MFRLILLTLTAFMSNYAVSVDRVVGALASESLNLPVMEKNQSYKSRWYGDSLFFLTQRGAEGRRVFGTKSQTLSSELICPAQLGTAIETVMNRPQLRRARWGILVEPLSPKARSPALYSLNADRYFIPASNTKLFTTAAALLALGSDYRIRTSVYDMGGGRLRVVGRGDPSLTDFQLRDLAQQLKRQGVRNVRELRVEDGYFRGDVVHPTWEWEDVQADYGMPVNSLIVNQNAVELTLLPQQLGQPLRVNWSDAIALSQWRIENKSVTAEAGTPNSVTVTAVLGQPRLRIQGQLAIDAESETFGMAILDPTNYFLQHFRRVLLLEGIKVEKVSVVSAATLRSKRLPNNKLSNLVGQASRLLGEGGQDAHPTKDNWILFNLAVSNKAHSLFSPSDFLASQKGERELATIESPPLSALVFETNQESNNLYAEVLLRTLQVSTQTSLSISPDDDSAEIGLKQMKATLTALGVNPESYVLVDGSGLSRHNLLSPDAIAQTLQLMAQTPHAKVYRASLPVAGISGSLKNRLRNTAAQGRVYAKTGGMTGVSALSGYLDVPGYQPLVFSIIVNQSDQSFATLRQAIDEIVLLLTRLRSC
jgi:D-alanyl-D-alanine carboxypeptidase/D-alanyl-D-alanine-endopeptidase (penicillin-binding protein 4)